MTNLEPMQRRAIDARSRGLLECGGGAAAPRRMIFILEIVASADALARVLCPFAVLQADLAYVELRRSGESASVRVEAEGLDDHRAQLLARRLAQSPIVRAVGLGWSCAMERLEHPALLNRA